MSSSWDPASAPSCAATGCSASHLVAHDPDLHRVPLLRALRAGAVIALLHDIAITSGVFVLLGLRVRSAPFSPRCSPSLATASTTPSSSTTASARTWRPHQARSRVAAQPEREPDALADPAHVGHDAARGPRAALRRAETIIRPFALAMAIGIVVGTYSSIYIASPTLLCWSSASGRRRRRPRRRQGRDRRAAPRPPRAPSRAL